MNRIYQGRITRIEVSKSNQNSSRFYPVEDMQNQATYPLWQHHAIFQDAVNYYMVALAALAEASVPGADRQMTDLRKCVSNAWERFPKSDAARSGARSFRDSLKKWLSLSDAATVEEAFVAILKGNDSEPVQRASALALLLEKCRGASGVQMGSRSYFPQFCVGSYSGSFAYSSSALAAGKGKDSLADVLHRNSSDEDLKKIADIMKLSWVVKIYPDRFFNGEVAKGRVREAIDHLGKMIASPSLQLQQWLKEIENPELQIQELSKVIDQLPEGLCVERNRAASRDLVFSAISFMVFPCQLTKQCLRSCVKNPAKKAKFASEIDFSGLGGDPVELSRGKRGYVFPSFTALPLWNPKSPSAPVWREFDYLAFMEALKALNQFNQKTKERNEQAESLRKRVCFLLGSKDGNTYQPAEENDVVLDPNLLELAFQLEDLLTQELSDSVLGDERVLDFGGSMVRLREGGWTITRRALRGFSDIRERWLELFEAQEQPTAKLLEKVVKEVHGSEGRRTELGSIRLFLALCQPSFWPLWRVGDSEESTASFLHCVADLHDNISAFLKTTQPVNLTPADPRHSRRAFMFSSVSSSSACKYLSDSTLEVTIADRCACSGEVFLRRARIHFSAPRLYRDQLLGGDESHWVQPMAAAFGLDLPAQSECFDATVSLMPDFSSQGELRFLLNFATEIDTEPLRIALGKNGEWDRQFNGVSNKKLHLHWPGTVDEAKMKDTPWWRNPMIIRDGFTILSTKLGQRTAVAWALIRVTSIRPETKRPVRSVGHDGSREWYAEILSTGIQRLPGEDAVVRGADGSFRKELSGKHGRMSTDAEWIEAKSLAAELGASEPENWVGYNLCEKSYSEQNDALISLAGRRFRRLSTYHKWSCLSSSDDKDRDARVLESLLVEVGNSKVPQAAEWILLLRDRKTSEFAIAAGHAFKILRDEIKYLLLRLANRTVPMRHHEWVWERRSADSPFGELVLKNTIKQAKTKVFGQRGISLSRINQMEGLRRLFIRYNRFLDRGAGIKALFGREDKGRESDEPCKLILKKIKHLKTQRVNQTAHLFLAQALGVRLTSHILPESKRQQGDIHGEYSRISGRQPVDMIVVADMDHYLTSSELSPSENSRLMQWCHRAVLEKLKMLVEEPFGIPIIESVAAYCMHFSSISSEIGFRCEERPRLDNYLCNKLKKKASESIKKGYFDKRSHYKSLLQQFEALDKVNKKRIAEGKLPKTLLLPSTGGRLFASIKTNTVFSADINGAINLGLRAIASPEAIHLTHKVRITKEGNGFVPVQTNAREKKAYAKGQIILSGDASRVTKKNPNFFCDYGLIAKEANGTLSTRGGISIPVAAGMAIWRALDERIVERIVEINASRLE